jgi:hypothetical protein
MPSLRKPQPKAIHINRASTLATRFGRIRFRGPFGKFPI